MKLVLARARVGLILCAFGLAACGEESNARNSTSPNPTLRDRAPPVAQIPDSTDPSPEPEPEEEDDGCTGTELTGNSYRVCLTDAGVASTSESNQSGGGILPSLASSNLTFEGNDYSMTGVISVSR
ncbi:MAG: hypothetical protein AAFY60_14970 [Myxococcota bacterium]